MAEHREPRTIQLDYGNWDRWSQRQKAEFYAQCDREMDEVGIVILGNVLRDEQCDQFVDLIGHELETGLAIEKKMNEKRQAQTGYSVYNLHLHHDLFMQHVAFPPVVSYIRRLLGDNMILHSSTARVVPPGTGHSWWHIDGGYKNAPGDYSSLTTLYYLCDSTEENGATRYIPGSHKKVLNQEQRENSEPKYINVKKGDVVMFNPNLVHSGSANRSNRDRPVIINYYILHYIKQEYDFLKMLNYVQLKKLSPDLRMLLGYYSRVPEIHEMYKVTHDVDLKQMDPYGL